MKIPIKYFSIAILVVFLSINLEIIAQVGIGISTPNNNSQLDITSSTKGFLPPRLTTAERITLETSLTTSALPEDAGMLVFDTDLTSYYYWDGAAWVALVAAGGDYVDLTTNQSNIAGNKTFTNAVNVEGMLTPKGRLMIPMGEISYFKTAGYNLTIPSIATGTSGLLTNDNMVKIDPGTDNTEFINDIFGTGTNSRLTYAGAATRLFHIALSFSYYPQTGKDSFIFAVAKGSGVVPPLVQDSSKMFITTGNTSEFQSTALHVLLELAQDDYIEFWVGNLTSAGSYIKIKSFNFVAIGM